jgi:hypothetical protein
LYRRRKIKLETNGQKKTNNGKAEITQKDRKQIGENKIDMSKLMDKNNKNKSKT